MDFTKLTAYLDSLQDTYGVPMSDLKVMKDHEVLFRYRFGHADFAGKKPLTDQHLFRLYSATKLITMTAVLQLVEAGKLKLEDRLSTYLPEYETVLAADDLDLISYGNQVGNVPVHPAKNPITIRQLMSMSAGFSYDTQDPNIRALIESSKGEAGTREIIAALSKTPLLYEPGTRWCYSLAHDVLAAVVEVISKQTFSAYLKEHLFEPLGAHDFYFHPEEDPAVLDRVCDIYTGVDDKPPFEAAPKSHWNAYCFTKNYESGGAGLTGSVDAYSLITDALACGGIGKSGKRILKSETVAMFHEPVTTTGQLHRDFAELNRIGYEYGLGVRVLVDNTHSKSPVGEFGWDGAAGAYALVDTQNALSMFYAGHVLSFSDHYHVIHPKIRDLVYEAVDLA